MILRKTLNLILLLSIFSVLGGCEREKTDYRKVAELKKGFPKILKPLKKDLPFKIQSHSILKSNNDSIEIYFGSLKQRDNSGNWIALASNNQIKQFQSFDFKSNPENEKENDIDINFNDSKNRVSVRIIDLDTITNELTYSWITDSGLSDSLSVLTLNKPLGKGKKLSNLELTKLNGETFDIDKFKGQIIIINWWAVWCAPCRKEIPGLNKLVEKYSNKNMKFIAITDDSKERVSNFIKNNEFKYEITFINNNGKRLFGNSYPKNIVVDSTGTIIYYSEGANEFKYKEIENQLIQLIKLNEEKLLTSSVIIKRD